MRCELSKPNICRGASAGSSNERSRWAAWAWLGKRSDLPSSSSWEMCSCLIPIQRSPQGVPQRRSSECVEPYTARTDQFLSTVPHASGQPLSHPPHLPQPPSSTPSLSFAPLACLRCTRVHPRPIINRGHSRRASKEFRCKDNNQRVAQSRH